MIPLWTAYNSSGGFPGVSVVKNPPADAGNTGSIPDPGRSHMLWSNKLLCHHCRVCAPEPRSPHAAGVEAHVPGDSRRERLEHRNKEEPPAAATGEKPSQPWRPSTAKNKSIKFLKKKKKKKQPCQYKASYQIESEKWTSKAEHHAWYHMGGQSRNKAKDTQIWEKTQVWDITFLNSLFSKIGKDCSISVLGEASLSTTHKTHWPEISFWNDYPALQLNNQLKTYLLHNTEIYSYLQFLHTVFFFFFGWAGSSGASGFSCGRTLTVGHPGFSSFGSRALEHRLGSGDMKDLRGSGTEPVSPALTGRFFIPWATRGTPLLNLIHYTLPFAKHSCLSKAHFFKVSAFRILAF